ncbi:MAG: aminotransferase class I/II-fold pyridoxal phosphate-dependent enzyme [Mariprofundales bacterium]|nr:aminotransferase class I/II-fold pyridoxal phosphate-dependent enzyme [Mariprofundales bacterium]
MNRHPRLDRLGAYPFERLESLLADLTINSDLPLINAGAGEPRLPLPDFVADTLQDNLDGFSRYPPTRGSLTLRQSIADWLMRRYPGIAVDADTQLLTANGTREALFAIAHAAIDPEADERPFVLLPNPMYQIYLGAAWMAGATPYPVPALPASGFQPDWQQLPDEVWSRAALIYCCSPSNPTGWVADAETYRYLLDRAQQSDALLVADECYSEIYYRTPPVGLLQVAAEIGHRDFANAIVFNSLSKRSALPGLRSGLIAGDSRWIERFAKLRSYTGAATPLPLQRVAAKAWSDERHVADNLNIYRDSLDAFYTALGRGEPADGGFFVWLPVPDDQQFAREAFAQLSIKLLPGSFLGVAGDGGVNPGEGFVRIALVDGVDRARELGERLRSLLP